MMFNFSFNFLLLTTVAQILAQDGACSFGSHHHPCPPNPIDECASLPLSDALLCVSCRTRASPVNTAVVQDVIHDILSKLPSLGTYYSMGVAVGASTRLVVGKQTHYRFDSAKSLRTSILSKWHHPAHFLAEEKARGRPVVIFTDSRPNITHLSAMLTSFNSIPGTDLVRSTYYIDKETFTAMETKAYPNSHKACANFEKWVTRATAALLTTNAFVLPMSSMCLKSASVHFYPVVGHYQITNITISGESEPMLNPIWQISMSGAEGPVPKTVTVFPEDF